MSSFAKKRKGVIAPDGASTRSISLTSLYISVVLVLAIAIASNCFLLAY